MSVSIEAKWDRSQIAALETGPLKAALRRALRKAGATALRDMRSEASKRIRQRKRIKSRYIMRALMLRRAKALGDVREPAVACPGCGTRIMPVDLLAHLRDRCPGPPEPVAGSQWATWGEAVEMVKLAGVSEMALSRWVRRGEVRYRGARGDREYLLRDLVLKVAAAMVRPRR